MLSVSLFQYNIFNLIPYFHKHTLGEGERRNRSSPEKFNKSIAVSDILHHYFQKNKTASQSYYLLACYSWILLWEKNQVQLFLNN